VRAVARHQYKIVDGRAIAPSGPCRSCATDDCREAVWRYLSGDVAGAEEAVTLALNMMRAAARLDVLRGETTDDS
jgi:hypothetical protein